MFGIGIFPVDSPHPAGRLLNDNDVGIDWIGSDDVHGHASRKIHTPPFPLGSTVKPCSRSCIQDLQLK